MNKIETTTISRFKNNNSEVEELKLENMRLRMLLQSNQLKFKQKKPVLLNKTRINTNKNIQASILSNIPKYCENL